MTSGLRRSRTFQLLGIGCAALIALATMWPSLAQAQLAPGYSGTSSAPEEGTDKDYLFMMRQLGPCLVSNKTKQSIAMLAAPAGSAAEDRAFRALFNSRNNICLGAFVSARIARGQVRGSLAEALYRRNLNAGAVVGSIAPHFGEVASLHDFARCYVSRHSVEAQALLELTRLGTTEEREKVVEMSSDFQACLPDRQIELDPSDVRMALAEELYKATL